MDDSSVADAAVVMTFRLQVPNPVIGSIIGKSGEVIKAIREQSQCRVIIADAQPGEDRDLTIKGTLVSVDTAVTLIINNICQSRSSSFEAVSESQPDESISLKVLVANDQAGAIIGKGGEVIKRLREESGARISIGKKIDFIRTITVIGNVATVRAAMALLVRHVHDHPSSARDPFISQGYRSQGQGPAAGFRANQQQQYAAGAFGMPGGGLSGYGMPQPGVMDPMGFAAPISGDPPSSLTLSLPHRTVGSIIGKRGVVINEIRQLSGCRVDISPSTPESQSRTVTLTGSPHSIEIAHMMIQKYTYQSHPM